MKHKTYINCGILGEEVNAVIYFDCQPEEKAVLYPIDDAYPGCAESADITSVMVTLNGQDVEVLPLISSSDIDDLIESCIESVRDGFSDEY